MSNFNWDSDSFTGCEIGNINFGPLAMVIEAINEKRYVTRQPDFILPNIKDANTSLAWCAVQKEIYRLSNWFFWRKTKPSDGGVPLYFYFGINPGQTIGDPLILEGVRFPLPMLFHSFFTGTADNNNEPLFRRFKPRTIYNINQIPKNKEAKYARFEAKIRVPGLDEKGYSNGLTVDGTPVDQYGYSNLIFEWKDEKWNISEDQTVDPDLLICNPGWARTGDYLGDWIVKDCIFALNLMTQTYCVKGAGFDIETDFSHNPLVRFNSFDVNFKYSFHVGQSTFIRGLFTTSDIDLAVQQAESDYKLTKTVDSDAFSVVNLNEISITPAGENTFSGVEAETLKTTFKVEIKNAPLMNKKTEFNINIQGFNYNINIDPDKPLSDENLIDQFVPSLMNDGFGWDDTNLIDFINKIGDYAYRQTTPDPTVFVNSFNSIEFEHFDSDSFTSGEIGNSGLYPVWNRTADDKLGRVIGFSSQGPELYTFESLGWQSNLCYIVMNLDVLGGLKYRKGTNASL